MIRYCSVSKKISQTFSGLWTKRNDAHSPPHAAFWMLNSRKQIACLVSHVNLSTIFLWNQYPEHRIIVWNWNFCQIQELRWNVKGSHSRNAKRQPLWLWNAGEFTSKHTRADQIHIFLLSSVNRLFTRGLWMHQNCNYPLTSVSKWEKIQTFST